MSHDAILAPTDPHAHPQAGGTATGHPDAAQALGLKVAQLETELAAARRDIARLARVQPSARSSGPTPEQLRLQSQAWGRLLGISSRAHVGGGTPAPAAARTLTFEDIGARFFIRNIGKVWLALALLTAVVVAVREQWF